MFGESPERKELRQVVDGFLRGDSTQYRLLQTRITQFVYHQHFGTDSERDELVSETIAILLANLRRGDFQGDSLKALNVYIYMTIKHRIGRVIRRRNRLTYTDQQLEVDNSGERLVSDEVADKQLAERILAQIDDKCRELLNLKFREMWSDQEIADRIKKTKNATSTAISRCLKKAQTLDIVRENM